MLDLEELERLHAAATPGPWSYEPDENFFDHDCQIIKGNTAFVCEFVTEKNAAYIVAACNSLPELIAENRALQERVRELEGQREILARNLAEMPWCLACQIKICSNTGKNIDPLLVNREECQKIIIRWAEQAAKEFLHGDTF